MKIPRGHFEPENNHDCRALAPFVMALFDGEADEIEVRRARAHLLICPTCARRWLDWNRSRDLLQSAPVPAPPPQLLWRVLLACRLTLRPQRALQNRAMPAHLGQQILTRTTRRAPMESRPIFSPLKLTALAAPALAVWLMVLQRDVWLPAPVSAPAISRLARPKAFDARRAAVSSPQTPTNSRFGVTGLTVTRSRATRTLLPTPRLALAQNQAAQEALRSSHRPISLSRRAAIQSAFFAAPEPSGAVFHDTDTPSTSRLRVDSGAAMPPARMESRRTSPSLSPRASRRPLVARLAATVTQNRAPLVETTPSIALRRARPLRASTIAPPSAPQMLRVSLPSASAPQPVRLLAENFDSDDARIDEIRSVVEDFRATLGPDDATGAEVSPDDISG